MAVFTRFLIPVLASLSTLVLNVQSYAITGAQGGVETSGQRPFRTEINNFAQSGPPFDLYILALQQLQQTSQSDLLSFFQIGGIHGYPTITWDGAPGNPSWGWGYCEHDNDLFPSWHRPYVALYEQALYEAVQTIAATYSSDQKGRYVQAALRWRMPYWDWAANQTMPSVATSQTITINGPNGTETMTNPMYQYNFQTQPSGNGFPDGDASGSPPFSQWMNTIRWPDSNNQSQNDLATQNFQQNSAFLISTVYQVLTSGPNYTQIATSANSQTSIEYVHDVVHYFIGGPNGHMDYLQWAGFDPMFFLHHANVDRILALWQALYPDSYVTPSTAPGNFAVQPGTAINETTGLSPFHSDNSGTLWTSDGARTTRIFGYTYPEIIDWNVTASQLTTNVRQEVNQLYNPGAGSSSGSSSKKLKRVATRAPKAVDSLLSKIKRVDEALFKELDINNLDTQWIANLQVNKFALNSSFNIDMFLGTPPDNPDDWPLASNLVGTFAVLSSAGMAPPSNVAGGATKNGQIPFTAYLAAGVAGGVIPNLDASSVVPLLQGNLALRVRHGNGATIDDLSGFSMTVASRAVTPAASLSDFPTYGDWVDYPEIQATWES